MNATKTTDETTQTETPKFRDVTVTFDNLPLWGPAALFKLLHERMGQPDLNGVNASLTVKYSNMSEAEEAKLSELEDELWLTSYRPRRD